jgi:hypothetical protein
LTTLAEATPAMATTAAVENFMFEWFGWWIKGVLSLNKDESNDCR